VAAQRLITLLVDAPPAGGAVAMGTGALSIAFSLDGQQELSRVLLAITAVAWITIVAVLAARAAHHRRRVSHEVRAPAALAVPAATAVLGTGLSELNWRWASVVLLVAAFAIWLPLAANTARWREKPMTGTSLLLTVSAEALAVLGATVAIREHVTWVAWASGVLLVLGAAAYLWVVGRFDFGQLLEGLGDQWIAGGGVAIATLAAASIARAGESIGWSTGPVRGLEDASVVMWWLSIGWLIPLLICEVARPRLRYRVERWSTVFPFAMYALCSFVTGSTAGVALISDFARVWIWVALAVWLAVFAGMLARGLSALASP
jgi:tellurite resistance protein TehA-like permease